jgi:hypothetical protein
MPLRKPTPQTPWLLFECKQQTWLLSKCKQQTWLPFECKQQTKAGCTNRDSNDTAKLQASCQPPTARHAQKCQRAASQSGRCLNSNVVKEQNSQQSPEIIQSCSWYCLVPCTGTRAVLGHIQSCSWYCLVPCTGTRAVLGHRLHWQVRRQHSPTIPPPQAHNTCCLHLLSLSFLAYVAMGVPDAVSRQSHSNVRNITWECLVLSVVPSCVAYIHPSNKDRAAHAPVS